MNLENFWVANDCCWPAKTTYNLGPWIIRCGKGGGKRVSAATRNGGFVVSDVILAEDAMRELSQPPMFRIYKDDEELDSALSKIGYSIIDPSTIYSCNINKISTLNLPLVTAFTVWPPLHLMEEIWLSGGIGLERLAVMDRTMHPKTSILGRINNKASGCAFVSTYKNIATIHAVHVLPSSRRLGLGRYMLIAAANWAMERGCLYFSLISSDSNEKAKQLYTKLGMEPIGHYHYRIKT